MIRRLIRGLNIEGEKMIPETIFILDINRKNVDSVTHNNELWREELIRRTCHFFHCRHFYHFLTFVAFLKFFKSNLSALLRYVSPCSSKNCSFFNFQILKFLPTLWFLLNFLYLMVFVLFMGSRQLIGHFTCRGLIANYISWVTSTVFYKEIR